MYNVEIKNCNNITMGHFKICPEKLNIKYGINGTGKTTISKAIDYFSDNDKLQELKSFYSEDSASITIDLTYGLKMSKYCRISTQTPTYGDKKRMGFGKKVVIGKMRQRQPRPVPVKGINSQL